MRPVAACLGALLTACGGSDGSPPPAPRPDAGGCEAGDVVVEGGCSRPGVPADGCGEGFEPDGVGGCRAILPAEPCGKGTMATPGSTSCAEVVPCPDGTWGDIPVDATTEHVDAAYAGADSDGTSARPWTSIQQAVDAAAPGAIVAVAAGSYEGDVLIVGKKVRLYGRCPGLVEIVGGGDSLCSVGVLDGAHASELHDLAITGPRCGFGLSGSKDVVAERLWVHDTGDVGMVMDDNLGASSLTIRGSLLEQNRKSGMYVEASPLVLEHTVVRDTRATAAGAFGRGIVAQIDLQSGARASLTVRSSLLERCVEMGILSGGSDVDIDSSVIRGTLPQPSTQQFGRAVALQDLGGQRASGTLRATVIESSYDIGLMVGGADAIAENMTVRDTQTDASTDTGGRAVTVQVDPANGEPGTLTLRRSLLENSREFGIAVVGGDAVIEDVVVRMTEPAAGLYGDGVGVSHYDVVPASASIVRSRIEASARAGITASAAHVEVGDTVLDCAQFPLDAEAGAALLDLGGNVCGCNGETFACAIVTANLEPPGPAGF